MSDMEFLDADPTPQPDPVPPPAEEPEVKPEAEVEQPDPEEVPLTDEEHAQKVHKKTGSQRAREAAQREREARIRAEAQLEVLKGQLGGNKQDTAPVDRSVKPRAEDFETHEAFVEALTDFKLEQKLADREQKQKAVERSNAWEQQKEAARTKYADFDEVFNDAPMPVPVVAGAMLKHPAGVEIGYYLAKNPTDYRRIQALSDPVEIGFEMAAIAARIASPDKPKSASSAPKPPVPVTAPPVTQQRQTSRHEVY